jgi:hypothetical protein
VNTQQSHSRKDCKHHCNSDSMWGHSASFVLAIRTAQIISQLLLNERCEHHAMRPQLA